MRKFTLFLSSLLAFAGVLTAGAADLFEASSSVDNAKMYYIKNVRQGKYVVFHALMTSRVESAVPMYGGRFKFITTETEGVYKIYSADHEKYLGNLNGNKDELDWYIFANTQGGNEGFSISEEEESTNSYYSWNDYSGTTIGNYNANDAGSIFVFEEAATWSNEAFKAATDVYRAPATNGITQGIFDSYRTALADKLSNATLSEEQLVTYTNLYYHDTPTGFIDRNPVVGEKIKTASEIDTDTWYAIYQKRGNGGYMWDINSKIAGNQVYKSNGTSVIAASMLAKDASPYLVRFIPANSGDENVYNLQFATGHYIGSQLITSDEDPIDLHVYNTSDEGTFALNLWSNGEDANRVDNNGSGSAVTFFGTGTNTSTDANNIWNIFPVTMENKLAEVYAEEIEKYQPLVTAWAAAASDSYFYPNSEKVAAMQALLDETAPNTQEGLEASKAKFASEITLLKAVNLPADGNYVFSNKLNEGYGMQAGYGHNTLSTATNNNAARAVWKWTNNTDGTITLQNAVTNEYIQEHVSDNIALKTATSAVNFNIVIPEIGYVAIGTDKDHGYFHSSNGKVVGWTSGANASMWTITSVNDGVLRGTYSDNEKTLSQSEIQPLAQILGVTYSEVKALSDYNKIYENASDNVYRIKTAGANERTGMALGVYNNSIPAATTLSDTENTKSSNIDQLWRLQASDDGFKLIHLNREVAGLDAAIAPAISGGATATPFTTIGEAGELYIDLVDADAGTLRFRGSRSTNDALYIETEARNYHISMWAGNNSIFSVDLVEDIEINLTTVGDNTWASAYLPFGVKNEQSNVKMYTLSEPDGSSITLNEVASVADKQGVVLQGESGVTSVTLTIDPTATNQSYATGTTVAKDVTEDDRTSIFVLSVNNKSGKVGFYNFSSARTIGANRAFIEDSNAGVRGFAFSMGGVTTAIDSVEAAQQQGTIYDLSGRRVSKAQRGLYIQNGKKFVK